MEPLSPFEDVAGTEVSGLGGDSVFVECCSCLPNCPESPFLSVLMYMHVLGVRCFLL